MITRFMRDTPLAAIEIEMQLIPGFTPRACGTFRSQQRYVNPNPILYEELLGLFLKEIEIQAFALRVKRIIKIASNLPESEVNQMLFRNAEHNKDKTFKIIERVLKQWKIKITSFLYLTINKNCYNI